MGFLSRIKIRTKMSIVLVLFAVAFLLSFGGVASWMHARMVNDLIDKMRAVALTTTGFAQSLQDQVANKKITQEQAFAMFRDAVHRMRFGTNGDYLLVQDINGMVIMHGGDQKREGKPTASKDASGRPTGDLIRDVLRTADSGVIWYEAILPGTTVPQPKVSYVAMFAPWQMVFIAGTWTDEVETTFRSSLSAGLLGGGGVLVGALFITWLVNRDITRSLDGMTAAMKRLAEGNTIDEIPARNRGDEIGSMAASVQVFKVSLIETGRLRSEQELERHELERERRQGMLDLAARFEASVGSIVDNVASAAIELQSTSQAMASTSEETMRQSTTVASASEQATQNVQTVATATEELSSSIREIGQQVTQASAMIQQSVAQANESNEHVRGLTIAADKIGDVVSIISDIAGQTNLLALNATIEAARAGDAGKGFAVVASEVKALATQTAKATGEIATQIKAIQEATRTSALLIRGIAGTIGQLNETATAIASAVEEQGAATQEIARNVHQAALGTQQVSGSIASVSGAAQQTGAASTHVLASATELSRNGETLKAQVVEFLREVRTA